MASQHYPYKVAVVYPDERTAAAAMRALAAASLADVRVTGIAPDATAIDREIEAETGESLETVRTDAGAGDSAGAAAGDAAAAPALFVSAAVVGPLVILGYGALTGGASDAIRGLRLRKRLLAGLLRDALKAGYYVVLLHAASGAAQRHAEAVISATLPGQPAQS